MSGENTTKRRLNTHSDQPVLTQAEDAFGFVPYADAFSLLINDSETATPLTVAISGPWGSGKTSLAHLVETRLKVEQYWLYFGWEEAPITCWFNAWMHSDAPHLGSALAASVTRDVGRRRPWLWRLLSPLPSVMLSPESRAWRKVWYAAVIASLGFLAYMGLLWLIPDLRPTSGHLSQLYGRWRFPVLYAAIPAVIAFMRRSCKISDSVANFVDAPRSAAAEGTLAEVREQLGRVIRQAQRRWGRARRRVVIFVDDLERCPGDKALDMCEVVSQLLGHDNVVTVLVADLDLLESAAEVRYRPSGPDSPGSERYSEIGQEYLHKLIQLRFNLPPLDRKTVASALGITARLKPTEEVPGA
jgi:hypothetical protein